VAGLSAGREIRECAGRAAFDAGQVGRRRPRRVRRILVQAVLEFLDLLLETHHLLLQGLEALFLLLDQGAEGGLGSSGDLLP
jgi:hypothetical protein